MREEEKLARDVYKTLFKTWSSEQTFANIAKSEQNHMDRMLDMLNNYSLTDPVLSDEIGVFRDQELKALYDSLVKRGQKSLLEALHVGALIEEVDIRDLENAIEYTDESMLDRVYGNLKSASHNHLRAFVGRIKDLSDVAYEAQHLSQAEVDAIVK
jgi:hypothetical protein